MLNVGRHFPIIIYEWILSKWSAVWVWKNECEARVFPNSYSGSFWQSSQVYYHLYKTSTTSRVQSLLERVPRLMGKCLTTFSTSVHYVLYNTATTRCSDNSEDGLVDMYVNLVCQATTIEDLVISFPSFWSRCCRHVWWCPPCAWWDIRSPTLSNLAVFNKPVIVDLELKLMWRFLVTWILMFICVEITSSCMASLVESSWSSGLDFQTILDYVSEFCVV